MKKKVVNQQEFSASMPLARVENPCHGAAALRRQWWIPWLILAVVLLIFAPVCRHGFVEWDDNSTIERNPLLQHPSLANVGHYWTHAFMDLYVPVTYTVWSAVAKVSTLFSAPDASLDPRFFHTTSVLLHAFNATLVFWLLRRLLKRPWPAAAGALLFALHPVQVEPVAWASGMKDLLCGTFSLLALNQYVLAVAPANADERDRSTTGRQLHYVAGLMALVLGMLSKPTAMVTPALALTIDLLVLGRSWRAVLRSVWPWFLVAFPCLVWTKLCQPNRLIADIPLWQRPPIATDALAFYLYKIVLPVRLAYDYGRSPWTIFTQGWAYWTWVVPVSLAMAAYIFRRRSTIPAAAGLLMVIGVAPVLGLTVFDFEQMSTVADHYLYLAMLGPALLVGWALGLVPADMWSRAAVVRAVVPAGLLLLAVRTSLQQRYWKSSEALFTHAIDVNPASWSSYYELGYLAQKNATDLMAATGINSLLDGKTDEAHETARLLMLVALKDYDQTIATNPQSVAARHGRALVLMHFGRYREAAEAFADALNRRHLLAPEVRAEVEKDFDALGQCEYNLGRYAEAVQSFENAVRVKPPIPGAAERLSIARTALAAATQNGHPHPAVADIQGN